jgi:hypothetical protein
LYSSRYGLRHRNRTVRQRRAFLKHKIQSPSNYWQNPHICGELLPMM